MIPDMWLTEGGQSATGGGSGNLNPLDGTVDLNPDFVFESRGHVTPTGYEIEIRIPFKSLRYGEGAEQTWGINILRRVQHSGHLDSWAPAKHSEASFLAQSGRLAGLSDMHRGVVLDVNPEVSSKLNGAPGVPSTTWQYDDPTARAVPFCASLQLTLALLTVPATGA